MILALIALGVISIEAKRCNSCCAKVHCSEKEQNRLKKLVYDQQKEIDMLRSQTIHLDPIYMFELYDDKNNFIGNLVNKYSPNLIGKNMRIVPRTSLLPNSTILYMDTDMQGVFIGLQPGRYTSQQISLPKKSISSIVIPEHLEVVLYSEDNFKGNSILVENTVSNLVMQKFNDETVSIEILEKNNGSCTNYLGKAFYNKNFNGKSVSLVMGENKIDMFQIKSLKIEEDYQIIVYENFNVIDIIDKNSHDVCLKSPKDGVYTFVLSKIDPFEKNSTIILFKDINYNGNKYYIMANNKTNFTDLDFLDGSISSIKIPDGLNIQVFDKPDFTGSSIILSGNIPNLKNYAFNDRIQSLSVNKQAVQYNNDQVILYSKPNFKGDMVYVPLGFTKCDIDNNDFNGFCRNGSFNPRASSIYVPNGYVVILEKKPVLWEDKTYYYLTSDIDIRNWIDSAIVSIHVKKI